MQTTSLRYCVVATAALLLGGCSKGDSDLRAWIDEVKARPGAQIEPLPVMQKFTAFDYNAQNLRDPFASGVPENPEGEGSAKVETHPKEELERFPLDSLDMVGTIGTAQNMEALIKDPDGVVHRVHIGNYLGQNNGKIIGIAEEQIDLVEIVSNGAGGLVERPANVALEDNK
jgi:type IV pilus assembly protein PilP